MRQSSAIRRGGVTIAILPPDGTAAPVVAVAVTSSTGGDDPAVAVASTGGDDLASMLSGCPGVVVVDEAAVSAAFSCLANPNPNPNPDPNPNPNPSPSPNPNPNQVGAAFSCLGGRKHVRHTGLEPRTRDRST